MQSNNESSEKQRTFQRRSVIYKILDYAQGVWNYPVEFNYLYIIPIIIVVGSACNYIYLVTLYVSNLTRVLKLDIWSQTAFVSLTTFFVGNMVGNSIMNWKSFCNELKCIPSFNDVKTTEESKAVEVSKTAMKRKAEMLALKNANAIQILTACASSCHKRYSLLNLFHVNMLCILISCCTYQYLKHKLKGFSLVNEHLRYLFSNHYLYESFVDHPEWPQQKYLPIMSFAMAFFLVASLVLCKRVVEICRDNSVGWHPKDCLEFLFGTRWYLAMLWPFVGSPEPQVHEKSS